MCTTNIAAWSLNIKNAILNMCLQILHLTFRNPNCCLQAITLSNARFNALSICTGIICGMLSITRIILINMISILKPGERKKLFKPDKT